MKLPEGATRRILISGGSITQVKEKKRSWIIKTL